MQPYGIRCFSARTALFSVSLVFTKMSLNWWFYLSCKNVTLAFVIFSHSRCCVRDDGQTWKENKDIWRKALSSKYIYGLVWRGDKSHFTPGSTAGWQTKPPFFQIISLLQKEGWGRRSSSNTRRLDIICNKRSDETSRPGSATWKGRSGWAPYWGWDHRAFAGERGGVGDSRPPPHHQPTAWCLQEPTAVLEVHGILWHPWQLTDDLTYRVLPGSLHQSFTKQKCLSCSRNPR